MPELPEVETVMQGLLPHMLGERIGHVIQRRVDLRWPLPENFAARMTGRQVEQMRRRGKYIVTELDNGQVLLVHLGMSGRWSIVRPDEDMAAAAHDHIELHMVSGTRLIYNDPRRFGAMDLCATDEVAAHKWLKDMGPEPLGNEFHGAYLWQVCGRRKSPMKSLLLDQRIIAGVGNIYVCEALWETRISPQLPANELSESQAETLANSIKEVLKRAIIAGGSSLRDYRQANGELGYFQHQFHAYGREGEACHHDDCAGQIARITQAGRSTFYCNQCQIMS